MHFPSIICLISFILICLGCFNFAQATEFTPQKIAHYREKVKRMFYHAYNGYLDHAYPFDELKPLTCGGMDTWGSFSLTLVDALDTLIIMGNYTEFDRAAKLVVKNIDFDANVNVSVFETNIRVIGGLLSAHMLSGIAGVELEDGWPCSGPLLRLAEKMASKLLPAFNTHSGMPFGTVNLRYGVHKQETPITCTAGVGTFLAEFASISRLTGSPVYERVAMKALNELWKLRSTIGLVGNHVNVQTSTWTATDAGIGAGVDSYFEYLVKGSILLDKPELMRQFKEYKKAIDKYVKKDDWFMWVSMNQGQVSMPVFQSLEAFWPGTLTLIGEVDNATRILLNYYQVVKQYGFIPEFYNIPNSEAMQKRSGYPLRPEFIESLMYLYRATEDPLLLQIGAELVDVIDSSSKTRCGYATVQDVKDHVLEDRMESFFLAETAKYLYLLFDPDNFIHNPGVHGVVVDTPSGKCVVNSGGYVFNTEAHPLDPSIIYCCDKRRRKHNEILTKFEDNLDILGILGLSDNPKADFQFTPDEFGDEMAVFNSITDQNEVYNQDRPPAPDFNEADIGYEIGPNHSDEKEGTDSEGGPNLDQPSVKPSAPFSTTHQNQGVVEALESMGQNQEQHELVNKVLKSPNLISKKFLDKVVKSVRESLTTSSSINLTELLENWKEIMELEKQIESISKFNTGYKLDNNQNNEEDSYAADLAEGHCIRSDFESGSPALNAMLHMVYSRSHDWELDHVTPVCRPNEAPKEEDSYTKDTSNFTDFYAPTEDDKSEDWTLSEINSKSFSNFCRQAEYHYELMSCKPRPFMGRFSGLGAVLPENTA